MRAYRHAMARLGEPVLGLVLLGPERIRVEVEHLHRLGSRECTGGRRALSVAKDRSRVSAEELESSEAHRAIASVVQITDWRVSGRAAETRGLGAWEGRDAAGWRATAYASRGRASCGQGVRAGWSVVEAAEACGHSSAETPRTELREQGCAEACCRRVPEGGTAAPGGGTGAWEPWVECLDASCSVSNRHV